MMGIESINDPSGHTAMVTPRSINDPPQLPETAPTISAIAPDQCAIGSDDFTLYVSGENFFAGSVIHFAGHDEPTTLNEDGSLSTGVKPSLWLNPDTVQCQIRNGEMLSNAVDFVFTDAASRGVSEVDPDDLEDEIEQAEEEGDFKPTHPKRRRR